MKALVLLTILQAVTIEAAPRDKEANEPRGPPVWVADASKAVQYIEQAWKHITSEFPGLTGLPYLHTTAVTSKVTASVSVQTKSTASGMVQILPSVTTTNSAAQGTVITSLGTSGHATSGPLISTSIPQPSTTLKPLTTSSTFHGDGTLTPLTTSSSVEASATSSAKSSTPSSANSSTNSAGTSPAKSSTTASSVKTSSTSSASSSTTSSSAKTSSTSSTSSSTTSSSAKISSTSSASSSTTSSSAKTSPTSSANSSTTSSSVKSSTTSTKSFTTSSTKSSTTSSAKSSTASSASSTSLSLLSSNIFQPVATNAPPSVLGTRPDHPVPRLGIEQNAPISTNKFYANFFLGDQTAPTFTHPYSVAWVKGGGASASWGMSISHIDRSQLAFGPNATANPVEYFINPIGISSIILSATNLGSSTTISTDSLTAFGANVNFLPSPGAKASITFPLVQGMGFVTGIYYGSTPVIQSIVLFNSVAKQTAYPKYGVSKFVIVLEDGKTWYLYAYSPAGLNLDLVIVNNGLIQATSTFDGIIQIAKNPTSGASAQSLYDAACGAFATDATLSGTASGTTGSYSLSFTKAGMTNATLLMFALPHHIESLSPTTALGATAVQLETTTKGLATAIVADSWTMIESLPTTLGFGPWSPTMGNNYAQFSAQTTQAILKVATSEVSQNMSEQTNLNSMYYSGKALAKFAQIVYTLNYLLDDPGLAQAGLVNLKKSFAVFASNQQQYPLVYETAWGGIVSSASYLTGDSGADFGNTYYNDHHFHYGYFILTGAIIGLLDPTWLTANAPYVNALVRDIANPSPLDIYFPVSRMFDWYHGHSWAHGLYETFDGKDEESSSEDSMSAYALKLWGHVIGDANLEARGNLQLALTARSLQNYFLYTSNNTIQPANFIGNKVSGILFENKIDHTTYFGTNIEYIQGIHMLPILPHSPLTRTKEFVTEEWNTYFSNGRAHNVDSGWAGILFSNLAIIDPVTSYNFFNNASFDGSLLDGGASRTWYMAFAAAMGGAS